MGACMASSYAYLFMLKLEQVFKQTQDKVLLVRWKYINEVFTVWTHGKPALHLFLENLNHHHTTVKFTMTWLAEEFKFVDM